MDQKKTLDWRKYDNVCRVNQLTIEDSEQDSCQVN